MDKERKIKELKEEWKDIPNYEKLYKISNYGKIISCNTGKEKQPHLTRSGYNQVNLSKNDKVTCFYVHKLVAQLWIPNPENKKQVNHLDGKLNNRVDMLEWCTQQENNKHSAKHVRKPCKIAVHQVDIKTKEIIKTYDKILDAKKDGFNNINISMVLNKDNKSHGGYKWVSVEPIEKDVIDLPGEIWKCLSNSNDKNINTYTKTCVSNMGRIRIKNGALKKIHNNFVTIHQDKKCLKAYIYVLILKVFNIPNPENKKEVDHIDSDHTNNTLENLRWATRKENMNNQNTKNKFTKKLRVTDRDGNIQILNGIETCGRTLHIGFYNVRLHLKNGLTYKGYKFEQIPNEIFEFIEYAKLFYKKCKGEMRKIAKKIYKLSLQL